MDVAVTVELMTWVQGFAHDAQVMGPPSLVASIGDAMREAADQYGGEP